MKRVMLAAVVAVFLPITSSANDLTGRFGMSSATLSSIWSGGSFDADYNTTNYGLTYSFDNGYSIDYSVRIGEDLNSTDNVGEATGFNRDDTTITVNRALDNGYSVFAGIIDTEYTIDLNYTDANLVFSETIETDGFFIGGSKTIPFQSGFLGVSLAYADLDLTLSYAGNFSAIFPDEGGDGFSFGLTYARPVAENVILNVEYKNQVFAFDTTDDEVSGFGANLVYMF